MSYVYFHSFGVAAYQVGFYSPDGAFVEESRHEGWESAAARVHYLNGGTQVDCCDCEEKLAKIREMAGG